jgi:hypothetical protein
VSCEGREEHWLRVFEYRVLREIFGTGGGGQVKGTGNELRSAGHHDWYCSPNVTGHHD